MSKYINDPREMAIQPELGVVYEEDNRKETMYHNGSMVVDLCDMDVTEYMKPMTVITEGDGGTNNYNELENLPSINNVKLLGNVTNDTLGLYTKQQTDELISEAIDGLSKEHFHVVTVLPPTEEAKDYNVYILVEYDEDGITIISREDYIFFDGEFHKEDPTIDIEAYATKEWVEAADEELSSKIGELSGLTTVAKTDIVSAINEVDEELSSKIGELSDLATEAKTDIVSAINEAYDKCMEPFRVKQWKVSWTNGISIPACTNNTITNTQIPKMTYSISGEEGENYQIVGMIAYEVFDNAGNRINCWPVCQFTGNGQKELSVRWCCMGTDSRVAMSVSAWVLLKHR